ncbi:unnamed protein product [Kuraishia capsulata CBS 1993]|uniref:Major facilitator superfamily (MFS) profile domain-containing protein n=1 Tax=Kuraishia capsulata CBS 1993 TaxID=1382522 RepID=W6MF66_9ASCO|nr:uncharacterized protein KUCA_T00000021001 [Kuraishia capsulata CBS 1993]CDK24061.1 unnamed protein product [Kuraishia capsulata CBS 1993]
MKALKTRGAFIIMANQKFNDPAYRKALRKPDIRIVLWYSFMYLIVQMNKSNVSNAAIMNTEEGHGIKKQLGNLTSGQWAWVLSCFYYPYLFFEPLTTVLMKRFSPSRWQARLMVTWGIVSMAQAACKNYSGIIAARFFLGLAEAGFYPTVLYHLGFWYRTHDLRARIAFFYGAGQLAGFISGLLAYGVSHIDGKRGIYGWQWLFIIEGILPILGGIYTWFFLPDYPADAKMLTEEERELILSALPSYGPQTKSKTWDWSEIKPLLKTPSFYSYTVIWICHGIGGWGISFILPTIIYGLGFTDTAKTQLMTMPPAFLTFFFLCIVGYVGTWRGNKGKPLNMFYVAAVTETVNLISYIVLLCTNNRVAQYLMVLIANGIGQTVFPLLWPDRMRAAQGTSATGLAIGATNCMAQFLGIVGPQIYQTKFGPSYHVSYAISLAMLVIATAAIVVSYFLTRKTLRELDEKEALEEDDSVSETASENVVVLHSEKAA